MDVVSLELSRPQQIDMVSFYFHRVSQTQIEVGEGDGELLTWEFRTVLFKQTTHLFLD